jgi:hypothetical protein
MYAERRFAVGMPAAGHQSVAPTLLGNTQVNM